LYLFELQNNIIITNQKSEEITETKRRIPQAEVSKMLILIN